jgi:hypothetical protein
MKNKKPLLRVIAWSLAVSLAGTSIGAPIRAGAKKKPRLSRTKATIRVGGRIKLRVKNASGKKVKWSSTKKKVATVTSRGVVKGKKAGKAVIRAKVGRKTLKCRLTVKAKGAAEGTTTSSAAPMNSARPGVTSAPPSASAGQTATAKPTKKPTGTNTSEDDTKKDDDDGVAKGDHILADASEGLTISAGGGVYSFKMGMSAGEITAEFGEPQRTDKLPQGYDAYIYYSSSYEDYFQVYVDNGVVVGAATMSSGFNFKNIVKQGDDVSNLSGFDEMPSGYSYEEVYYQNTGEEYVMVCNDRFGTVGGKGIYGIQIFRATDGDGDSVSLDNMMMGNKISQNGGYDDSKVLEDMSKQLFDWGCAFRAAKGLDTFAKFTKSGVGDTAAQAQSDYNAEQGESSQEDNSGKGRDLNKRFTEEYASAANEENCYVYAEFVADASPDAFGYYAYWLNGTEDTAKSNYNNILKTKNSLENLSIGTYYLCAGVSYNASKKATFAVLDLFAFGR